MILLFLVFLLGVLVPSIAVIVRRLHDSGNSGRLCLLVLIPYLGSLVILIFGMLGSSPAGVPYDKDPTNALLPTGSADAPGLQSYTGQRPAYQDGQPASAHSLRQSDATWQTDPPHNSPDLKASQHWPEDRR